MLNTKGIIAQFFPCCFFVCLFAFGCVVFFQGGRCRELLLLLCCCFVFWMVNNNTVWLLCLKLIYGCSVSMKNLHMKNQAAKLWKYLISKMIPWLISCSSVININNAKYFFFFCFLSYLKVEYIFSTTSPLALEPSAQVTLWVHS